MVLAQEHRATLFVALSQIASKDAAEAMLAEFPNHELDEPVTKGFVRAEIAEVRTEMAETRTEIANLRTELKGEISDSRTHLDGQITDLNGQIADLRTELKGEISDSRTHVDDLRTELKGHFTGLHTDIGETRIRVAELETRLLKLFNSQLMWVVGALVSALAVLGALFG